MAGSWRVGAQPEADRRLPPRRRLAAAGHDDRSRRRPVRPASPARRGEIWLSDSDVIIVPKGAILVADDFINLVFTRGIYGVFPLVANLNFAKLSSL